MPNHSFPDERLSGRSSGRSPWLRRLLWYSGWLVWLPVAGYGISTGNLWLTMGVGGPLFLASLYFSLQTLVCPECGHAIRTVGASVSNCMQCGAAFARPKSDSDI
ncbi:hypothetical protein CA51_35540 [Rosistilla oblonga]|nr:hypothetical protein CA51_35540 [Rosistilla oblonga]